MKSEPPTPERIPGPRNESRVLLLPPTARDAEAVFSLLSNANIPCTVYRDMHALCHEIDLGVGTVIISEESLANDSTEMQACIRDQPVWSDLPVLVLSRSGVESPRLSNALSQLGNVSVLERPVRVSTLLSVVRSALRARERQYQVREHLAQRDRLTVEREQLLESERIARSEAERASQMKDEFLATLSHELRTPLNAIVGWAQILRSNPDDVEEVKEGMEVIERNARGQAQIIEDLLDMSRIISGKVRLDVQRVDLASVVSIAVKTVRPAADAKGVRCVAVLDSLVQPISGDPSRLQQVFWNLLTNAVKFTPRGGQVKVTLQLENSQVQVSVSDTGEGIETAFLPHVFDRFRQADASTTRRHGGLGLGLAIVKQLVELHGGTVRAESGGTGLGSTFIVTLPVKVMHLETEPEPTHRHPASAVPIALDLCTKLHEVKVLVVDDEPDARVMLQRVLHECDAIVYIAASAAEAFDVLRREKPDVLISDIGMPVEDGYALIRKIRALTPDEGGKIPAIALTAYARSEDRVKAIVAGFQQHLSKPVEPAELITLVGTLSGRT